MPQVVQIQRAPNSWDQAGQTVQQTADNFLKSMLAMGQMQNNNAWRMAEMNLQNQRIADANARQDKQLAAIDARHKEDSAQRLQMHNDTMALHRAQMAQAGAAMNKSQVVMTKGPYGEDVPVLFNPRTQQVSPFPTPGMGGGAGGALGGGSSMPGLDAAATAGMNEVLSPNWSPTSGGGQQDFGSMYDNGVRAGLLKPLPSMSGVGGGVDTPSPIAPIPTQAEVQLSPVTLDTPKPTNPLYELGQRAGIFPQTPLVKPEAPQYSDNAQPGVLPKPQAQQQAQFKPGDTIDPAGNSISLPDGIPWNGPHEVTLGDGKKWSVMINPRSGAMRILGGKNPDQLDSLPMDTGARKEAMDLRSQWDEAARVEKQLNSFGETGGNGGTGLLLGMLPQTIQSRIDPEGVPLRSAISQMSSVIMNALSGAAVSDQERKRLEGFLPTSSDNISTIRQKLAGYKDYISTKTASWRTMYGDIKPLEDIKIGGGGQKQSGGTSAQLPAGFRLVN